MKVLVITNMYPSPSKPFYGTFVKEQVRCFRRTGISCYVVGDKGEGKRKIDIIKKYISLLLRGIYWGIKFKPEVLHAHYIFPTGFIALIIRLLNNSPVIITAHRGDIFEMPFRSKLHFYLTKFTLAKCSKIISVSEEIKDKMVSTFNIRKEKISVIDMGVNFSKSESYFVINKRIDEIANKNTFNVIFVGMDFKRKGGYKLFEAIKQLDKNILNKLNFDFIGAIPLSTINNVKKSYLINKIKITGLIPHEEVFKHMLNSDIFILPSESEGLPIALLEAMSLGLNVIVTPVGDVPFLIKHKINGYLIPNNKPETISSAIRDIVKDKKLRKKLSYNAFITAKEYSSSIKANNVIDIYKKVIY